MNEEEYKIMDGMDLLFNMEERLFNCAKCILLHGMKEIADIAFKGLQNAIWDYEAELHIKELQEKQDNPKNFSMKRHIDNINFRPLWLSKAERNQKCAKCDHVFFHLEYVHNLRDYQSNKDYCLCNTCLQEIGRFSQQ